MVELSGWVKSYFAEVGIDCMGMHECELIVDASIFTWVPEHLYSEGQERRYLELLSAVPLSCRLYADYSAAMKAYMVFATDNEAIDAFRIALTGLKIRCQHSKLVNATLIEESRQHATMLVQLREGKIDVEAFDGGRLLLSNSFPCANRDEMLYHSIGVMKSLNIESPLMVLMLCGNVDRELYAFVRSYFPKVRLYTGRPLTFENPAFQPYRTYQHAVMLS